MHPVIGPLASLDFSHIGPRRCFQDFNRSENVVQGFDNCSEAASLPASLQVDFQLQENTGDDKKRRNIVT
jgi:hypothetical protein